MRGLIRNGLTVLLGAALLTCALGTRTVFAEDLPGETPPQEQVQTGQEETPAGTAEASAPSAQPTEEEQEPPTEEEQEPPAEEEPEPAPAPLQQDAQQQPPAQEPEIPAQDAQEPPAEEVSAPQPAEDAFVTAYVYVRLGGELPQQIQTSGDSARYTDKLCEVRVNISELERSLLANGLNTKYTDDNNRIYYSHETTGLSDPYTFWNQYLLPAIADASPLSAEAMGGTFIGYVLKHERYGRDDLYHLDGIIEPAVTIPAPPKEEPSQPEQPTPTEQPAPPEQPTPTEQPEQPAPTEQPAPVEQSAPTEQPTPAEQPAPPEQQTPPVTAETFPRMEITTSVWNAARNNPSPAHADLAARSEIITYELNTTLPDTDAEWIDTFAIMDTLVDELVFATGVTVKVDGKTVSLPAQAVEKDGQTLIVDLPKEFLAANGGREISVSFGTRIREDVVLSKYEKNGRIEVPNRCSYAVWLHREDSGARRLPSEREPDVSEFSGVATVTPPAAEIRLEEEVNGRRTDGSPVVLSDRYAEVTYTIRAYVIERADMRSLSISDTIADVMEFRGDVEVLVGGIRTEGLAQIFDKTLVVSVPEKYLTDAALQHPVTVTFHAAIIQGIDLTAYIEPGENGVRIPNNASCQAGAGMTPVTSNAVQITPGDDGIAVSVNGGNSAVLSNAKEIFTFTLRTRVPERARMQRFEITDRIVDVLMFAGNVKVTVGGFPVENAVSISGQEFVVTLTGDVLKSNMGKAVIISFDVRLKDGADASVLAQGVANTASYSIDGAQPVTSNSVTVSTNAPPVEEAAPLPEEETKTQSLPLEGEEPKARSLPPEEKVTAQPTNAVTDMTDTAALKVLGARRTGAGTTELDARDAKTGDPASDLRSRETVMGMALLGLFLLLCLHTPKKQEEA